MLGGEKTAGKTMALLDMAVSVALGDRWLTRFECKHSHKVLVLTSEDGEARIWQRIDAITRSKGRAVEKSKGRYSCIRCRSRS